MTHTIVQWLTEFIFQLGYPGIALLMALESSFVPFPSEVVLPPAGYLAAQGRMSAILATAAGLGGSLMGALVNYLLAAKLGRPLLYRYGKYVLMKPASLERAEQFFRRHGEIGMFVGRLIPVIRQLISLPAGFARMRLDRFILYTAAGAGVWCVILTYIGWVVGRNAGALYALDEILASDQFHRMTTRAALVLIPLVVLVMFVYVLVVRRRASGSQVDPGEGGSKSGGG